MAKRGQITLFIIVGLVILLLAGLIIMYRSPAQTQEQTQYTQAELQQEGLAVQKYISTCLEKNLAETEKFGLKEDLKPIYEAYIKTELRKCADLSQFEDRGLKIETKEMTAEVTVSDSVVAAKVSYPITIMKDSDSIGLENFNHYIRREESASLPPDGTPTTSAKTLLAGDKKAELRMPAGTIATKEGQPIGEIILNILDRNFDRLENSVVVGGVVYEGQPEGAQFDPPIELTIKYDPNLLPPDISEESLSLAYYDSEKDLWMGLDSTVDTDNKKVTAQITHFTKFAVVINCGGGASASQDRCTGKDDGSYCVEPMISPDIYYCQGGKETQTKRNNDPDSNVCKKNPNKKEVCTANPNGGFKECKPAPQISPPAKPATPPATQTGADEQIITFGYVYEAPCYSEGTAGCPEWVIKKQGKEEFARNKEQVGEGPVLHDANDGPIYATQEQQKTTKLNEAFQKLSLKADSGCKLDDWDKDPSTEKTYGYNKVEDIGSKQKAATFEFELKPSGNSCVKDITFTIKCDDQCDEFELNGNKPTDTKPEGNKYTIKFDAKTLTAEAGKTNKLALTVKNLYEACSGASGTMTLKGTGAFEKCTGKNDEPLLRGCKCGNKNANVIYDVDKMGTDASKLNGIITEKEELSDDDKKLLTKAIEGKEQYCTDGRIKSKDKLEQEKQQAASNTEMFNKLVSDEQIQQCCSKDATIYTDSSNGCEAAVCKKTKDKNDYYYWAYTGNEDTKDGIKENTNKCTGFGGDKSVFLSQTCGVTPKDVPATGGTGAGTGAGGTVGTTPPAGTTPPKTCSPSCSSNQRCNPATGTCEQIDTSKTCDTNTYGKKCDKGKLSFCASGENGNYIYESKCSDGCEGNSCKTRNDCNKDKPEFKTRCTDTKNIEYCWYFDEIKEYAWITSDCGGRACVSPDKDDKALGGLCYDKDDKNAPKLLSECDGKTANIKICGDETGQNKNKAITCSGNGKGVVVDDCTGNRCENGKCLQGSSSSPPDTKPPVTDTYDLEVISITGSTENVYEGDTVKFTATIKNNGKTITSSQQFNYKWYVDGTRVDYAAHREGIQSEAQKEFQYEWKATAAEVHLVKFEVNPKEENLLTETNFDNNIQSKSAEILKKGVNTCLSEKKYFRECKDTCGQEWISNTNLGCSRTNQKCCEQSLEVDNNCISDGVYQPIGIKICDQHTKDITNPVWEIISKYQTLLHVYELKQCSDYKPPIAGGIQYFDWAWTDSKCKGCCACSFLFSNNGQGRTCTAIINDVKYGDREYYRIPSISNVDESNTLKTCEDICEKKAQSVKSASSFCNIEAFSYFDNSNSCTPTDVTKKKQP